MIRRCFVLPGGDVHKVPLPGQHFLCIGATWRVLSAFENHVEDTVVVDLEATNPARLPLTSFPRPELPFPIAELPSGSAVKMVPGASA